MQSLIRALPTMRPTAARAFATAADVSAASTSASSSTASTSAQAEPIAQTQWSPYTQRTGVIARKRGMTALWDQDGKRWPVTVLQVVQHTPPPPTSPLHTLQLGSSNRPAKTTSRALLGHFAKAGVPPKYEVKSFQVTPDAVLPVGTELSAAHFVPGQMVDVTATSIGKGFQGPMKRHGFRGLKATHGVSLTHRSGGSTGQHQDPGRVLPGKKMAGHMGSVTRTTQNLFVHRIDTALNCVFVRGAVPGADDAFVSVRDAKKGLTYAAQARFRKGREAEEWAGNGVRALPTPGMSTQGVREGGWEGAMQFEKK